MNAQARRRRREALGKALLATFERLQLYAHGARSGAWDEATQQALQRHLARGLGAEAVDQLLLYQQASPLQPAPQAKTSPPVSTCCQRLVPLQQMITSAWVRT